MPWLADLVQSSEGSLDVLPVQCLCEFLLHDAADESTSGEEEEEGESKEQRAKKRQVSGPWGSVLLPAFSVSWICFHWKGQLLAPQRQQKQRQLLGRLQDLLLGPKADEQTTCEVLDYFLRRLSSSQVASRVLAMKVSKRKIFSTRAYQKLRVESSILYHPSWLTHLDLQAPSNALVLPAAQNLLCPTAK